MAKRSVKTSKRILDPMFFVPDGVEDYEYTDKELNVQVEVEDAEYGDYFDGDDDADYSDGPPTPQILDIVVPHVIRTTPDGGQVVDVTILVEDIQNVKYEIRVAKVD